MAVFGAFFLGKCEKCATKEGRGWGLFDPLENLAWLAPQHTLKTKGIFRFAR